MKEFISFVSKTSPEFAESIAKNTPNSKYFPVSSIAPLLQSPIALGHIPWNRFSHPKEALTFVDALIESGVASQSEQGLVFVLGNTNTGKTSLVNTFKDFVAHPTENPRSVLTKPSDNLIETQVLEVYDGLSLKQEKDFKVELAATSGLPVLVNLKEIQKTNSEENNNSGLQLRIVDIGTFLFSIRRFSKDLQGVSKKRYFLGFHPISVLKVGFYFFTCVSKPDF